MKNLLKEEITQMQYLFGYKKGVVISEQSIVTAYKFPSESEAARDFLRKKFSLGPKYNSNWPTMSEKEKNDEYINARKKLGEMDMNQLAKEAVQSNVPEESIISLQKALETVAGSHLQFLSGDDRKNFVDGKLGTNTAAAWINYMIELMKKGISPVTPTREEPIKKGSSPEIKRTYNVGK
jgi:hypothetical protein